MRITRLLPALCLLGSTACVRAEILAPEVEPAADAQAVAPDAEMLVPEPAAELENCIRIEVVQVESGD